MVDIADLILRVRSIGDLREVALSKHGQVLESTVKSSALILSQNLHSVALRTQPKAILDQLECRLHSAISLRVLAHCADNDAGRRLLAAVSNLGSLAEDTSDAVLQFLAGSVDWAADCAVQRHDVARYVGIAIAVTRKGSVA